MDIQIGVLGIGTMGLASINAEVHSLIGQKVKDATPLKNTVFVTSANGRGLGYISDDSAHGHETFQVLNAAVKPGCAVQCQIVFASGHIFGISGKLSGLAEIR